MERLVKGDVIAIEFPFSNLNESKRRPSLVIKTSPGEDIIVCQITAESQKKDFEIILKNSDFSKGKLKKESHVRIDKITTLKKSRVIYKIGSLKQEKTDEIINKVCSFLKN